MDPSPGEAQVYKAIALPAAFHRGDARNRLGLAELARLEEANQAQGKEELTMRKHLGHGDT